MDKTDMYFKYTIIEMPGEDGMGVAKGVTFQMMRPLAGECIKYKGKYYTVTRVIYDFDAEDMELVAELHVIPRI